jgi:hypothetical protein
MFYMTIKSFHFYAVQSPNKKLPVADDSVVGNVRVRDEEVIGAPPDEGAHKEEDPD